MDQSHEMLDNEYNLYVNGWLFFLYSCVQWWDLEGGDDELIFP